MAVLPFSEHSVVMCGLFGLKSLKMSTGVYLRCVAVKVCISLETAPVMSAAP